MAGPRACPPARRWSWYPARFEVFRESVVFAIGALLLVYMRCTNGVGRPLLPVPLIGVAARVRTPRL